MMRGVRRCLALLALAERRRWAMLFPLALLAAALEATGAAAVFGLVALIGDPSRVTALPLPQALAVGTWSPRAVVLAAALAVGIFYIGKNLVLTALAALQSHIVSASIVAVSRRILRGYLAAPLVAQARRSSSELIRNSTSSVQTAFTDLLEPASAAATEACIVVAIVAVLVATAPLATLGAGVALAVLLGLLVGGTRRALARWGREEQTGRGALLQTLQQAFHGLKEIKVHGRERFFYDAFARQQAALAGLRYRTATLQTASRLLIETTFVAGVLIVVALADLSGRGGAELVPLLGLYAYAGFRVIPSINRILSYAQRMQYAAPAVDAVYDDWLRYRDVREDSGSVGPVTFTERLALEGVSFSYGAAEAPVLRDISFTVRRGESIGIIGPTGAGKTTLCDVILGLLRPTAGQVTADGTDIRAGLRDWQRQIGYVPQAAYLLDASVRRNVAFGLPEDAIDDAAVWTALRLAQLASVVAGLPGQLDARIGEHGARLSGGERQRLAIARALYHRPPLLILDEATAALDLHTERELARAIESLSGTRTLLIVAHRLATVRQCDRIILLRDGRVEAQGTFDELRDGHPAFRHLALADAVGP